MVEEEGEVTVPSGPDDGLAGSVRVVFPQAGEVDQRPNASSVRPRSAPSDVLVLTHRVGVPTVGFPAGVDTLGWPFGASLPPE
jgi:hypothetical protein